MFFISEGSEVFLKHSFFQGSSHISFTKNLADSYQSGPKNQFWHVDVSGLNFSPRNVNLSSQYSFVISNENRTIVLDGIETGNTPSPSSELSITNWVGFPIEEYGFSIEIRNPSGALPVLNGGNKYFSYATMPDFIEGGILGAGEEVDVGALTESYLPDKYDFTLTEDSKTLTADITLESLREIPAADLLDAEVIDDKTYRSVGYLFKHDFISSEAPFVWENKLITKRLNTSDTEIEFEFTGESVVSAENLKGKVYKINTGGVMENLHIFDGSDTEFNSCGYLTLKDIIIENGARLILNNCHNVFIEGLEYIGIDSVIDSAIKIIGCSNVWVKNLNISNLPNGINGLSIINSRNVSIRNSHFSFIDTAIYVDCVYRDYTVSQCWFNGVKKKVVEVNTGNERLNSSIYNNISIVRYNEEQLSKLAIPEHNFLKLANYSTDMDNELYLNFWKKTLSYSGITLTNSLSVVRVNRSEYMEVGSDVTFIYNFKLYNLGIVQRLFGRVGAGWPSSVYSLELDASNVLWLSVWSEEGARKALLKCLPEDHNFQINKVIRLGISINLGTGTLIVVKNRTVLPFVLDIGSSSDLANIINFNTTSNQNLYIGNGYDDNGNLNVNRKQSGELYSFAMIPEALSEENLIKEVSRYPGESSNDYQYNIRLNFNSRNQSLVYDLSGEANHATILSDYSPINNSTNLNVSGIECKGTESQILLNESLSIKNPFKNKFSLWVKLSILGKEGNDGVFSNCNEYIDWENSYVKLGVGEDLTSDFYEWTLSDTGEISSWHRLKNENSVSTGDIVDNSIFTCIEIFIPKLDTNIDWRILCSGFFLQEESVGLPPGNFIDLTDEINGFEDTKYWSSESGNTLVNFRHEGSSVDSKSLLFWGISQEGDIQRVGDKLSITIERQLLTQSLGNISYNQGIELNEVIDRQASIIQVDGNLLKVNQRMITGDDVQVINSNFLHEISAEETETKDAWLLGLRRNKINVDTGAKIYPRENSFFDISLAYKYKSIYFNLKESSGLVANDRFDNFYNGDYYSAPTFLNDKFHRSGVRLADGNYISTINSGILSDGLPDNPEGWGEEGVNFRVIRGLTVLVVAKMNTVYSGVTEESIINRLSKPDEEFGTGDTGNTGGGGFWTSPTIDMSSGSIVETWDSCFSLSVINREKLRLTLVDPTNTIDRINKFIAESGTISINTSDIQCFAFSWKQGTLNLLSRDGALSYSPVEIEDWHYSSVGSIPYLCWGNLSGPRSSVQIGAWGSRRLNFCTNMDLYRVLVLPYFISNDVLIKEINRFKNG